MESSFMEEASSKVGRYSAEERKERIHRYRAKRNQRNFNKTIKYACRKTLADNRPRIRGRFARNDEPGEIPKAATFNRYEDEDDLWMDGFHDEEDEGTVGRGPLFNDFGANQFQQERRPCVSMMKLSFKPMINHQEKRLNRFNHRDQKP
ncbi:hypothetical protein RJ639_017935 [Escallonia herrerae]|uniref:CCT domain-containing protein n=1 Tax=Escallonia herrerae TaxID=1293975 RepID=A0AA88VA74_9ASTE|nr:hypothetical protein RJ639_017935 [Escallonia herrerae]